MPTAQHLHVEKGADGVLNFADAAALYDRWGCFIAKGLLPTNDLGDIQAEIQRLITLARGKVHGSPPPGSRFDAGYLELCEQDPELAEAVFIACRRLTSAHAMSVHPGLVHLSQKLMGTELVMCNPYKPIRIDVQQREGALLPWHQDYPYAQDSIDAVIYWIPLQDVDDANGCLLVAPGSHKLGVVPVVMILPPAESRHGIKGLTLAEQTVADQFPSISLPMQLGDVLVFSTLLLHKSQRNLSPLARWTFQVRHGNFAHPLAIQKRWPRGHFERHWFDDTHPEYVVSGPKPG